MTFSDAFALWFNTEEALVALDLQALAFFIVSLILLVIAKLFRDLITSYSVDEQLTTEDNKAVGLSFSGFIVASGIIIWGTLTTDPATYTVGEGLTPFLLELLSTFLWSLFGLLLLGAGHILNDKLLLPRFEISKELVTDKNTGAGAVVAGAFIGTALIIRAALTGEDEGNILISVTGAVLYFLIAQLAFIVFGILYAAVTKLKVHEELEQDNSAVGVAFGMDLVAIGILLSGYLTWHYSLLGLVLWFVVGAILLLLTRLVVDKLVLPKSALNHEIVKDRNWGAAIIEGSVAIVIALILNGSYY